LVLAAAICSALGSEARAAGWGPRSFSVATIGSTTPKPTQGPFTGEPDSGPNGPLPPKTGSYPTGGGVLSSWALRVHMLMRFWLGTVPKRFP
jgi:hypothetical protein